MTATPVPRWNPFRRHNQVSNVAVLDTPPPRIHTRTKTWGATVDHVPSWPEEARALKKHNWVSYVYGVGDVLLVFLPIYFILLGIATITLNGKPTKDNSFGPKVESAMQLGPTMFPILFAAISGRSMKMIARYLAERGAKLSTLELMMASQSVWGTFESQLLMQRLTLVGINLLFLWALSPLGGQASLRLMERHQQLSNTTAKLRYLTTGPAGACFGPASNGFSRSKYAEAGALYNAALLAPHMTKIGPQDSWGNVKIPRMESLNTSHMDENGWITLPNTISAPEYYSSLVGLPIAGLPSAAYSSNFTVEYNYLSVECGAFKQSPYPGTHGTGDRTATNYTELGELVGPGRIWYNKSDKDTQPFDILGGLSSFMLDTPRDLYRGANSGPYPIIQNDSDTLLGRLDGFMGHYNQSRLNDSESHVPRELVFASVYGISIDGVEQGLNVAKCSLFQHHTEALINCRGSQCTAIRVRKSLSDNRPNALTSLEDYWNMENFVRQFPIAIRFTEGSSPTELFMANTSSFPFAQTIGHQDRKQIYADLSRLPPDVFSRRLSLMLNSYYQLSSQSSGYFGGLTNNLSAYGPDTLPVVDLNAYLPANLSATNHSVGDWYTKFTQTVYHLDQPFLGATTTAQLTSGEEIFRCDFAWLSLLFVSSSAILLIGSAAVVLKRRTLAPEMFGLVSSMTYENRWVKVPDGGTMLDAMERTRLLKDVEVRIGDVHGDKDVGHIAFAAGVPIRKLERGRLYD